MDVTPLPVGVAPGADVERTDEFPFPFLFTYGHTSASYSMPYHVHPGLEIMAVHHGKGTMFIDGQIYPLAPGAVFLFDAAVIHRTNPLKDSRYQRTNLILSPLYAHEIWGTHAATRLLDVFAQARATKVHMIRLRSDEWTALDVLWRQLQREANERKDSWSDLASAALIAQVLVHIGRNDAVRDARSPDPTAKKAGLAAQIVAHLEERYAERLSLDDLSARFHVNKHYMCRAFKRETGFTITEYVLSKRLVRAKGLLEDESLPILSIAMQLGFSSSSHFSQTFRSWMGITPSAYRKSLRSL